MLYTGSYHCAVPSTLFACSFLQKSLHHLSSAILIRTLSMSKSAAVEFFCFATILIGGNGGALHILFEDIPEYSFMKHNVIHETGCNQSSSYPPSPLPHPPPSACLLFLSACMRRTRVCVRTCVPFLLEGSSTCFFSYHLSIRQTKPRLLGTKIFRFCIFHVVRRFFFSVELFLEFEDVQQTGWKSRHG